MDLLDTQCGYGPACNCIPDSKNQQQIPREASLVGAGTL